MSWANRMRALVREWGGRTLQRWSGAGRRPGGRRMAAAIDLLERRMFLAGDLGFAIGLGNTDWDEGWAVSADADGNVYVTGNFRDTVDFDPGPADANLTDLAYNDVFVAKYTAAGDLAWARSFVGTGPTDGIGTGIAVDASGNVYTTGQFAGTTDFDPGPGTFSLTAPAGREIFVSKLDASGNFVWAGRLAAGAVCEGGGIAVDGSGGVYVTGSFNGEADFDPGPGASTLVSQTLDAFIVKLDAAGTLAWAGRIGSGLSDYGIGIGLDGSGNVYAMGTFMGTVDFDLGAGTSNLTSAGTIATYIAKYSSSGTLTWAKTLGGSGALVYGRGLAVSSGGNIHTVGYFSGSADFDPGAGSSTLTPPSQAMFISKLDSAGNYAWVRASNGIGWGQSFGVALDATGNVHVTGAFSSTVDFDPGAGTANLTSGAATDTFILKLTSAGIYSWARRVGGSTFTDSSHGNAIAASAAGGVYVTGGFAGTVDFDPGAGSRHITSGFGAPASLDIFVLKLVESPAAGVVISPTSGLVTTESGGTATFTVTLQAQPTADVAINLSSSNTAEGTVSPASLTFTTANWNTPRTVTVTGVNDAVVDGDKAYTIITAAATSSDPAYIGMNAPDVSVTNTDNDAPLPTVTLSQDRTVMPEYGGQTAIMATLSAPASQNVTVNFSFSGAATYNTDYHVSSTSILIPAGQLSGILLVTASGDPTVETDETVIVDISSITNATEQGVQRATTAISDDDSPTPTAPMSFSSSIQIGGTNFMGLSDMAYAIALDPSGNTLVTGRFSDTADFDPGAGTLDLTAAGEDIFIAKYTPAGQLVWASRFGGTMNDRPQALATDIDGNVYVTGLFWNTVDFDPGPGEYNLTSTGLESTFILKLDSSGALVWARAMGGSGNDDGRGIAVDGGGNVYITGMVSTIDTDLDPGPGVFTPSLADGNQYILKLDAAGAFVWAKIIGGSGIFPDGMNPIALDASGNVYLAGFFDGSRDFNPDSGGQTILTSASGDDIFIVKLDTDGRLFWVRQIGGAGDDQARDITIDSAGNVLVTGTYGSSIDFDPGAGTSILNNLGFADIFILKLDSAGQFVWARGMGGASDDTPNGIATDSSNNVYTTGDFSDGADLDPNAGHWNFDVFTGAQTFISKLSSSGSTVWAQAIGGFMASSTARDIAVSPSGDDVYITGNFGGTADFDPGMGTHDMTSAGGTSLQYDAYILKLVKQAAPALPTVTLTRSGSGTLQETAGLPGSATITATLSATSAQSVTVNFAFSGTATRNTDYAASATSVIIPAGQLSRSITITVTQDALIEGDETILVDISTVTNATEDGVQQVSFTLADNDFPQLSIADAAIAEGDAGQRNLSFTVTLSAAAAGDVTVDYATADGTALAGSDYAATSGTLTFIAGQTSKTILVPILGDGDFEANEAFTLTLSSPTGATFARAQATGTILDDDFSGVIALSAGTYTAAESGGGVIVTVTRTGGNGAPVSVAYATRDGSAAGGIDYAAASGTLEFAAGQTAVTLIIPFIADSDIELDELFHLDLSNPGSTATLGATAEAAITIVDDDVPLLFVNDVAQAEGNFGTTPFTFTVTLSTPSPREVSIAYGTFGGGIYAASGTLVFAAGEVQRTVDVQAIGDTLVELDEVFNLFLSSAANATIADAAGQGTIIADDLDIVRPSSRLAKLTKPKAGAKFHRITVLHSDNLLINALSIGKGDILVTGPGRFQQILTLDSKLPVTSAKAITAIYRLTAPGGKFDAADNGVYTIWLRPRQVTDIAGNRVPKTVKLGTLTLAYPSRARR